MRRFSLCSFQETLATHFFIVWNLFESMLATSRARGYLANVIYMPDESYCRAQEEVVERWIASKWYNGPNLSSIASDFVESYRSHMQFALRLHQYQLDEAQLAALLQLLFVRYGKVLGTK